MRKVLCGAGIFLFLFLGIWSVAVQAAAVPSIQLWINGNKVRPEVPPQLLNSRTLVPVYTVQEGMGMKVDWDAKARKVTVTDGSKKVELTIGSKTARVNGTAKKLDVAPVIIGNRTFLPFRAVGELLGVEVGWEDKTKSVIVNAPVRFQVNGQAVSAKVYRQNDSYFVTARQIAPAIGYTITQQSGKAVFSKGEDSKILSSDTYKIIDNELAVPLSFVEELTGGSGAWNQGKTVYTLNKLITPPPPKKPEVIKVTDIQQTDDIITIRTDKKAQTKDFTMSGPPRIVVDVQNAKLAVVTPSIAGQEKHPAVQEVRYSQFDPETVRVVVVLAGSAKYNLVQKTSGIELQLKDIAYPQPPAPAPPITEPPAPAPPITEPPVMTPGDSTSAQPNPVPSPGPLSLKEKVKVVVDAGHGGKDMGAIGNNAREKDLTLAISQRLADNLRADAKFDAILTRDSELDRQLTERGVKQELSEKVKIANDNGADLFISIHINSSTSAAGKGTETYYYSEKSKEYAATVHKYLVQATGFGDRKMKTANFYVIKNTKMPAILIEIGFISNPTEAREMMKEEFQQRVADAVYAGIKEYVEKN
ncbi:N-acetylmuramoyl-L-alanine amidase family protein [Aneurinibacillus danicus]|uniref:MurNAc-LAA domain-containing protein n=1 Tax=Aneurinibacillus danicus TaxID=267746 RepID=A0A511VAF4_9BACL|nr:N-acetylmuramoyl-L-alanine amidase family protein [Aneurinibacillus danicus]GEN35910.1 hypothetical protein ADA01nite_33700 [Aneurinibacillus danicus]